MEKLNSHFYKTLKKEKKKNVQQGGVKEIVKSVAAFAAVIIILSARKLLLSCAMYFPTPSLNMKTILKFVKIC